MSWKKTIRRTILIVLAMIVILAGAAYVTVHTRAFQRFVLAKATEVAEARTGAQVEIKSMAIHWAKLSTDLYGVTIYGKGGTSQAPLFQSAHLGVGLKIVSLFRRKIDLAEIVMDRPVVHFRVNEEGQTNLPKSPSAGNSSMSVKTLFDLAVRHVAINGGQIYYNNEEIPLSAELADFGLNVSFDALSGGYKGSLGYDRGRIAIKTFKPIEHNARVQFVASRSGLVFDSLSVSTRKSRFTAHATLADYAHPSIQGEYETVLYTPEIAQVLKTSWLPAGEIAASGTMRYRNAAGQSFLNSLNVDGRFRSSQLALRVRQVNADAKSVRGAYTLEKGNLGVANLQADVLGGHLSVNSGVLNLTGQSSSRLSATLQGASLEDVSAALRFGDYQRFHFVARADVNAEISWSKRLRDLVVQSHTKLYAQPQARTAEPEIPLNGVIDVRYDGAKDEASFGKSYLRIGNTELSLNGTLSKRSNLSVQLKTSDLHELSTLAVQIEAAATSPGAPASAPLDLHGSAQFAGYVFGSPENPRLQGHLSANDVQVEGTRWRSIQTNVELSSSGIALRNGALVASQQGQLHLNANAGLQHWSLMAASPVSIAATAANVSVADLQRLAKVNYPVSGVLSGNFLVEGTKQNPSGHGSVRIVKASAWNQPVDRVAIDIQGSGNSLQSKAELQTAAGAVTANLTYVLQTQQYEIGVHTSGLKLNEIQAIQARDLGIEGTLAVSATGRGTLKNPELSANLAISELRVRGQLISGAEANLNIVGQHANFTADATVDKGIVHAKGDVGLAGDYDATASLDVHALSMGTLVARYIGGSQPELKGQADIHAELKGPLKNPARIEFHVEVPTFNLAYQAAEIALVRPLRLDYRDGIVTLQKTELKGTGSELILQGTIPIGKPANLNVAANGTVDLSLLQGMTKGIKSSGRLDIEIAARGELSHPTIHGNVRIEKAALSSASIPVGLDGVNGQIRILGNRIEIGSLTGTVGGGAMSAQGFMIYGAQPSFNLAMEAKSVRVRYPQGLRTLITCNLRLDGSTANSVLSGRVVVDQLSFTQQFDLASLVGQFAAGSTSTSPSAFEKNMKLNVSVQSAENLRLASSQLSVQGAADLTLTGTLANPIVLGRATLAGGEIFFLSRRYEIQSGTLEFSNQLRTNPLVNIYASTSVNQYNITINFVGPVDRLRTNYTSDPPLPPSDIINLIAFGKTSEQAATNPSTPAVLGAESVLAKGVTSQVSGKIQKLAGVSNLTINPLIGNSQQNPGAQIAIQQRVTGSLLLTFTTDTTQTQNTTVQVQYRVSHDISISALRDQNGGYAVDVHLHKSF